MDGKRQGGRRLDPAPRRRRRWIPVLIVLVLLLAALSLAAALGLNRGETPGEPAPGVSSAQTSGAGSDGGADTGGESEILQRIIKNLKVYYLIIHMQQMMELILQLFQSRLLRYQIHVQNSLMSLYHLFQQQIRTVRLRNRLKMYNRLLKMGRLHLNRLLCPVIQIATNIF